MNRLTIAASAVSLASMTTLAGPMGGPYSIPWSTIDGGGVLNSSGGSYTLSGTIGQPDAGATMTGGSFSLSGGFWPGVNSAAPCAPDLNGDGDLDFFDISFFLTNMVDYNNDTAFDFFDISAFLMDYSAGCP